MRVRIAVVVGFVVVSCGGEVESPLLEEAPGKVVKAARTDQLFLDSDKVWSNRSLRVCWLTSGYSTEKGWVRDAVAASWARVANVSFGDWKTCPSNTLQPYWPYEDGIRVKIADENPRTSALGDDLDDLGER